MKQINVIILINIFLFNQIVKSQSTKDSINNVTNKTTKNLEEKGQEASGVSISPSIIRFNAKAGTIQTKTFKVNNYTSRKMTFQIFFQDYGLDIDGKTEIAKKPESKYSLSKFLNLSQNFIELKPGELKVITITASIPNSESGYIAMWTNLIIDEVNERGKLEVPNNNSNTIALGISTGIGFMIQVSQNPPNVILNDIEILKLSHIRKEKKHNILNLIVKNKGDGIGYCLYYLELTNLATGKTRKFRVNQFGVLPGYEKEINFSLPPDLPKGKYAGIAVIDFGDIVALQTAEIEFEVD